MGRRRWPWSREHIEPEPGRLEPLGRTGVVQWIIRQKQNKTWRTVEQAKERASGRQLRGTEMNKLVAWILYLLRKGLVRIRGLNGHSCCQKAGLSGHLESVTLEIVEMQSKFCVANLTPLICEGARHGDRISQIFGSKLVVANLNHTEHFLWTSEGRYNLNSPRGNKP